MVGSIKQMLSDFEHGVYNFTNNGECSCCGQCCSNVLPMTKEEIDTIRKYIKKKHIKQQYHICIPENVDLDLTCPFLDNSKKLKCTIYEVRPKVCRDFICDKEKMKNVDVKYAIKCIPVFLSQTFFGKDNL